MKIKGKLMVEQLGFFQNKKHNFVMPKRALEEWSDAWVVAIEQLEDSFYASVSLAGISRSKEDALEEVVKLEQMGVLTVVHTGKDGNYVEAELYS